MRLATLAAGAVLPLLAFAAKSKGTEDSFSQYHTKAKSLSAPITVLDDASYNKFTGLPRNYTSAILLTAMDARFGCQMCRDFQPEWELLAKSWVRGDGEGKSRLLFGTLDFLEGRQTFQSMNLQTAPVLLLFPPTVGPDAKVDPSPTRFDFSVGVQTADTIHTWLSRNLPESAPKPPVYRPFNWLKLVAVITVATGTLTFTAVAWPYLSPLLYSRNLWAALSIIGILLFTSGHMFNHIRGAPYVSGNGKGGIQYFAPGFQNQFGMESQVVAAMYAVLAFSTIALALKVPRMTDPKSQQVAVFIWGSVMFGMYSFLLSIFRVKNGGYPFWLPPF